MRTAHAEHYGRVVARLAPRLGGTRPGRGGRRARPGAAEPARGGAPPRALGPAGRRRRLRVEPSHLLVDRRLLRRSARVDAGAARQADAPDTAHSRRRMVLRAVGRDVAAPERGGRRRARRVRPAVRRERGRGCLGDGARGARDGARAVLEPGRREGRGRAQRGGRSRSATSATTGRRRSRSSRSPASRGCGATPTERSSASARRAPSPTASGDIFTSSIAANLRGRLNFLRGQTDRGRAGVHREPHPVDPPPLRRRGRVRPRGRVRRRRRARRDAARERALEGRRVDPPSHRRVRRRGVHRAHAAPRRSCASGTRPAFAAGEKAGADLSIAEAVELALPDADDPSLHEAMRTW